MAEQNPPTTRNWRQPRFVVFALALLAAVVVVRLVAAARQPPQSSVHPITAAYINAMTDRPSAARAAVIDALVRSVSDVLGKLDLLYLTAAHSEDALLDVVNPRQFRLTRVGNPDFQVDHGIRGDGQFSAFNTGFVPDKDAKRAKLNSIEMGVFVVSNDYALDDPSMAEAGNDYTLVKALETMLLTGAPTTVAARSNRPNTFRTSPGAVTTAAGLTSVARSIAAGATVSTQRLFRDARELAVSGGDAVSLGSLPYYVGGANTGGPGGFSTRQIGAFYVGASLSDDERTRLFNALTTYLQTIGAYDPASIPGGPSPNPGPDPYGPSSDVAWTEAYAGTPLDMSALAPSFGDEFNSVRTIGVDGGGRPWSAPVHAKVGFAEFLGPDAPKSPFSANDGVLRIRMSTERGAWQTGHMQTSDSRGEGFAQQYGYFEMRARMPPPGTYGAWPAFWLYSQALYTDPKATKAEIDVIEYYPAEDSTGHHATLHLRPADDYQVGQVSQHWQKGEYNRIPALADGGWHTYGALVTQDLIIIYFDGLEQKRIPTVKEYRVPLYMLVSLQGLPEQASSARSPIDLYVDYVRAYKLR